MGSQRGLLRSLTAGAVVILTLVVAKGYAQVIRIKVRAGKDVAEVKADAKALPGEAVPGKPVAAPKAQSDKDEPTGTTRSVFFDENPDVSARLRKARQLLGEKHYEAAFNLYMWVLENVPDGLFRLDENRYLSVREHCIAGVASLPDAFLRQYRFQVDGEVARLYDEAHERMAAAELDRLGTRYYLSSYGPEMLDVAGDLYAGRGELSRAAGCWRRLLKWGLLGKDISAEVVRAKLTVALGRMGRLDEARDQVSALRKASPDATLLLGGTRRQLVDFLEKNLPKDGKVETTSEAVGRDLWPQVGGDAGHGRSMPATFKCDVKTGEVSVRVEFNPGRQVTRYVGGRRVTGIVRRTPFHPVYGGGRMYLHGTGGILAVRVNDGLEDWFIGELSAKPKVLNRARPNPFGIAGGVGALSYACCYGDGAVYASLPAGPTGREVWGVSETGKLLWRVTKDREDFDWLKETDVICDPVLWKDRLYLASYDADNWRTEVFLVCLEAKTGEFRWRRFVCSGANMSRYRGRQAVGDIVSLPAADDDVVVVCSDTGGIAAVDARSGEVRWAYAYERNLINPYVSLRGRQTGRDPAVPCRNSTPVIHNGRVFVTPSDSNHMHVLDLHTGKRLWTTPRGKHVQIVGVADDRIILSGDGVTALSVDTGKALWRFNAETIGYAGQGFITRDAVYIPGQKAIYRFDRETGRLLGRLLVKAKEAGEYGNLLLVEETMLQVGNKVHFYGEWDRVYADIRKQMRLDAKDPVPQFRLGEIYARKEARKEAIAHYEKALTLVSARMPQGVKRHGMLTTRARERLYALYAAEVTKSLKEGNEAAALKLALRRRPHASNDNERMTATRVVMDVYRRRGDWTALVRELQQLIERPPKGVYAFDGDVLVSPGIYGRLAIGRLVKTQGPVVYAAFERKAAALVATGMGANLEKAVRLYPNSTAAGGALLRLADLDAGAGRPGKAAERLETYLRLDKGDRDGRMRVRWKLAGLYERDKRYATAARLLASLAEEFPNAVIKERTGARRLADVVAERLKRPQYASARNIGRDVRFSVPLKPVMRVSVGANARIIPHDEQDQIMLLTDQQRNLRCIDPHTGKEQWRAKLTYPYAMGAQIVGDRVVVCERQAVRMYDRNTGEQQWVFEVPRISEVVVNGRKLRRTRNATGVCMDDKVVAVNTGGGVQQVLLLDATTGKLLWQANLPVRVLGNPLLVRNRIAVLTQNRVVGFDVDTGRKLFEIPVSGRIYSSRRLRDGRILVVGQTEMLCVDLQSGKSFWRRKHTQGVLNINGVTQLGEKEFFVATSHQGKVICFDTATGRELWTRSLGAAGGRPTRMSLSSDAAYIMGYAAKANRQICVRVTRLGLDDGAQTWVSAELLDFNANAWAVGRQAIALVGNDRKLVKVGRGFRHTYAGARLICLDTRSGRVLQSEKLDKVAARANIPVQCNMRAVGGRIWAAFPSALIALEGEK